MSAKPYVVQEDSPNLVIVPVGTTYEPSPKKQKLDSALSHMQKLPTPTKNNNSGVFPRNCAKVNFNGGRNNDVLIDVHKVKKSATSWASNFLQSIGGSSVKFNRLCSTVPVLKSTISPKENTQPEIDKVSTLVNTVQQNSSTTTQPLTKKDTYQSEMNIDRTQPKCNKAAQQPSTNKEASQINSNYSVPKIYRYSTSTTQVPTYKEPSLPKGYKIPIQGKFKTVIPSVIDKESSQQNNIKKLSNGKTNIDADVIQLKHNKPGVQNVVNKELHRNEDTNYSTHGKKTYEPKISQERDQVETNENTNQLKYNIDKSQPKNHKLIVPPSNQNHTNKSTDYEHSTKLNIKMTAQSKIYKEINDPKIYKEVKHRKITKETVLPKSYRDPCPDKYSKDSTSDKIIKETCKSKNTKEAYNLKNKKEATYSSKLKTKKEHVQQKYDKSSKITKLGLEHRTKNHKDQTKTSKGENTNNTIQISPIKPPKNVLLKSKDIQLKLKNKASNGNAKEGGSLDSGSKKIAKNEGNRMEKQRSKPLDEEKLNKSVSPIKSVVTKLKSDINSIKMEKRNYKESYYQSQFEKTDICKDLDYHSHKSEKALHPNLKTDLRAILKRKINTNHKEHYKWDHGNKKNKFTTVPNTDRFVPSENLIISFDTKDDNEEVSKKMSPVKKIARKQPTGGKICKKIKLEINIVFDNADSSDKESENSEDDSKGESLENTDLSFLDDFNVDEIVESLNECKSSLNNESNMTNENGGKVQDAPSDDSKTAECMTGRHLSAIINNNEGKIKMIPSNEVTLVGNEMSGHQETELHSVLNGNRTYNEIIESNRGSDKSTPIKIEKGADVQCLVAIDSIVVKKEAVLNHGAEIEGKSESSENNTFDNSITNSMCSDSSVVKNISKRTFHPNTENPIFLDIPHDTANKMSLAANLAIGANEHSITSNNNTEVVKEENVDNDLEIIEKELVDTKTISIKESIKTDTAMKTINKSNEISTNVSVDPILIVIDDSESENETEEINQQSIQGILTLSDCVKEKPVDIKLNKEQVTELSLTTTEIAEPVLILDTDYDEISNDATQLNESAHNAASVDLILPKSNINNQTENKTDNKDTKDIVKHDKISPENTPTEIKMKLIAETEGECEKAENKTESKDDPTVTKTERLPNKDDKKDLCNIVAENTITKTSLYAKPVSDTVGTKTQDTKSEVETPNKDNAQDNTQKKDNVANNNEAKTKIEVPRSLVNDVFIQKLESRLLSFMDRKYTITELVHVGKYSKIYSCKDSPKWDYAVKVIQSESDGFHLGLQKQNMMMKLQNGVPENNLNCVRLIKGFCLSGLWCFLMDYYPSNLQEVLAENKRSFHIDVVQYLSRQLVSAVTILRNNNIIHSDIKPSHILMNASRTRLKLCGFDQASYFDGGQMLPNTGTVNYRAPELILGYAAGYGIDVWSTALVMFEMATNKKLFPGIFNNDILYKQLCTLGSIPLEMLMQSAFKYKHFKGTAFTRVIGGGRQRVVLQEIRGNDKMNNMLFQTYTEEWGKRVKATTRDDKAKLCAFSKLLHSMLVMHPKYRIAIEFVFANPFIYETFDNCYDM